MAIGFLGPGAQPPASGGVELAGLRAWVKSVLVLPVLFVMVVMVCALAGVKDWLVVLTIMSGLTIISEALLVRTGVTSLALSSACVVRCARNRTATVRAEDVSGILIRHLMYGPILVVSSGDTRIGLSLPAVYRNPVARDALASFLRRAGADPSLGEMGVPRPAPGLGSRPGSRLSRATGSARSHGQPAPLAGQPASQPTPPVDEPQAPSVRIKGRALAWVTFAALALTVVIGALRFLH